MRTFAKQKAIYDLADWWHPRCPVKTSAVVDTRDAPIFIFDEAGGGFSPFQFYILLKDKQRQLVFDDNDPGSIPQVQILGPMSEQPSVIFNRAGDTILWYVKQARLAGDIKRAKFYEGWLENFAEALGRPDLIEGLSERRWSDAMELVESDPRTAGQQLERIAIAAESNQDYERAHSARYWAGVAWENALTSEGHEVFRDNARHNFSKAFSIGLEHGQVEYLTDASDGNERLSDSDPESDSNG